MEQLLFERTFSDDAISIVSKLPNNRTDESGQLQGHKSMQRVLKLYSCRECTKTFSVAGNLWTHQRKHTGVKPYSCGECTKTFSNISNQQQHEKTQTGVKPYSCRECTKTFSRFDHL